MRHTRPSAIRASVRKEASRSSPPLAVDNEGASTISAPVTIAFRVNLTGNDFEIFDRNGDFGWKVGVAPASFEVRAQLLTIDGVGKVGPIGGIQQKLAGARDGGATWFLAPAGNCNEVVGHVPDGLRVVKVSTFAQARDAVEAIAAKKTAKLPTCT